MYIFIVIMSNVLYTLGYSRFLKKRDEFTMNYSEIGNTFDKDIYSVLKSRQEFKVVEDAILDISSSVVKDEKPLEVKDIVIKDMKLMNKEERLEEKLGKNKEDKSDNKADKPKGKIKEEPKKEEQTEPKKNLIDDNEKDFLFSAKPKKDDPEEKKIENEATFQNETKEILKTGNVKKISITQEALESQNEKSPRKKK